MFKFILKRLLMAIPTIICIIFLVLLIVHATPGGPFDGERALSQEALNALMHKYRLDLPFWKQFVLYLNDLLHGDFGYSYRFRDMRINTLLFPDNVSGFWVTLRLTIYAGVLATLIGISIGAYAGFYHKSIFDRFVISFNVVFGAIPTIVTGPMMVLCFAVILRWLPSSGFGDGSFRYLCLPVLVLVLAHIPLVAFVTRASILEVLNSNFIRTAKAKGLPTYLILFKHAIKPTMIPVVSLLGPMFASMLVGAVVTEQIFALPGLGILTTNAAMNRDYNMILAITVFGSMLMVFFNLFVDIIYFALDPKIKQ